MTPEELQEAVKADFMTPEERLEAIRYELDNGPTHGYTVLRERVRALLPPPPRTDKEKLAAFKEVLHWWGHRELEGGTLDEYFQQITKAVK